MKKKHKRVVKRFSWVLFVMYLLIMAYFLFFSEYLNRSNVETEYRYNIIFLAEVKRSFWCFRNGMYQYFIINFIMNILAFVPLGFFLPLLSKNQRKESFLFIAGSAMEFTLLIEIVQFALKVGTFDVDDIFLNTAGGIIGFMLYKTAQSFCLVRKKGKKK
ncbi:VanZ family protein [[Clostridium] polysaccharolyticum]|uniref:VanZ like family protein n=1 Tax=[Clostridium] polysaccharolyticum TaxID=29364 RepID=A0A1H9ZF35_9FIRM|nr:VanZ family protein [[Clostridium] polysaccharolyticum]SES79921.1 VanZ like family protein [[Clostridium] polysaccharolyticum]